MADNVKTKHTITNPITNNTYDSLVFQTGRLQYTDEGNNPVIPLFDGTGNLTGFQTI